MNNQARGCIYHLVSSCEMPCHVTQAGFYSHGSLECSSLLPRHSGILAKPSGKAIFSPLLAIAAGSAVNPPRLGDGFMLTMEGRSELELFSHRTMPSMFKLMRDAKNQATLLAISKRVEHAKKVSWMQVPSSHFGLAPFVLTTPQSRLVEGGAHNHIQQKS